MFQQTILERKIASLTFKGFCLKQYIMQIIKLLREHDNDLKQPFDFAEYTKEEIIFIRELIKFAYKEGFEDGEAEVMNDLDEFLHVKKEN